MKWSRTQTRALDKTTRRIMSKYKCHQRGSAPERLYMPRKDGGRGLQDLEATWEKEVVSAALYLINSEDPVNRELMRQQLLLNKRGRQSLICQAQGILDYRDLPLRLGEAGVLDEEGENVTTKQAMGHLKKA